MKIQVAFAFVTEFRDGGKTRSKNAPKSVEPARPADRRSTFEDDDGQDDNLATPLPPQPPPKYTTARNPLEPTRTHRPAPRYLLTSQKLKG